MSNYQQHRDEAVAVLTREGLPLDVVRRCLSAAQSYKRLAEAECNGDAWQQGRLVPCPNSSNGTGETYCPHCGSLPASGEHGRISADTIRMERIEARVAKLLPAGWVAVWQGDPRGAVLRLRPPSGASDDVSGEGLCVPTRY